MPDQPGRIAESIEFWFDRYQRPLPWRVSYDPYLVWVSEVMLQQTRMEVVLRYFSSFVNRFPDVHALATASEEQVLAAWSGLGYYRRARMIHAGARDVVERFCGALPPDPGSLQTIAGIGRYTAGAIASIAYRRRAPIVDGNVARVASRLFAIEAAAGSRELMRAAWQQAARLVDACTDPRALNQGLMEIGALICTPKRPDCDSCPVRAECGAWAAGRTSALPLPKERRVAARMVVPLYLIDDGRGRFLMRRERGSLMSSMFHLPHGSTALLGGRLLPVVEGPLIGSFRHTITTRNVEFRLHRADLRGIADGGEYEWVDPDSLAHLPHPSYVAKAVALAVNR